MTDRRRVPTAAGSLAYQRAGDGPPLVLLHSLALDGDMWVPIVGDLAADFDVIVVDLRGHGQSTYDGSAFTVEDMADDVVALFDALGLDRPSVLGMSMGGCVAMTVASDRPDRVARLVCCDTTAWYGESAPQAWAERAATASRKTRAAQIPFQVDRWFSDGFRRAHPEVVSHVVGVFLGTSPRTHAHACRALGAFDGRGRLGGIAAPTLVVTGAEDYAAPPAMGEALAAGIPDATFECWSGLRHFAILESPALRRRIVAFLRGEDPPAAAPVACCLPALG